MLRKRKKGSYSGEVAGGKGKPRSRDERDPAFGAILIQRSAWKALPVSCLAQKRRSANLAEISCGSHPPLKFAYYIPTERLPSLLKQEVIE